jgi:hypothetical protein
VDPRTSLYGAENQHFSYALLPFVFINACRIEKHAKLKAFSATYVFCHKPVIFIKMISFSRKLM